MPSQIFARSAREADIVAQAPDSSLWYYYATLGGPWNSTRVAGPGTVPAAVPGHLRHRRRLPGHLHQRAGGPAAGGPGRRHLSAPTFCQP